MRTRGLIFSSKEMLAVIPGGPEPPAGGQRGHPAGDRGSLPGHAGHPLGLRLCHGRLVAAFDPEEGIVSPGGVGYDINCGVRLLRTKLHQEHVAPRMKTLVDTLFTNIPSGVGSRRQDFKLTGSAFKKVLKDGGPLGGERRLRRGRRTWPTSRPGAPSPAPTPRRCRTRPKPRQGPVGHPGFGQPLRRSRLYRRDLRCGPGGATGAVPGSGDGHRQHRLPGAGAPGVRGLHQGMSSSFALDGSDTVRTNEP